MSNEQSVSIGNNFLHKHLLVISISKWTYMSTPTTTNDQNTSRNSNSDKVLRFARDSLPVQNQS